MRLLWLYLVVTLLVACWSWSFPDELLNPDGGVDSGADLGVDASHDGPAKDIDASKDLPPPDGRDGPSPDIGKPCTPPCDKTGTLPVCDEGVCRGCRKQSECFPAISDGELCAADGSCPAAKDIYYVSDKCGGTTDGSKTNPFCKIADAVGQGRTYVLVRAGTYTDDLSIDKSIEVYGEPGAKLKMADCTKLVLKGAATKITLSGFEIAGTVNLSETVEATLLGNTLGPSFCVGVKSTKDTKVTLERNLIRGNTDGGLDLDGTIKVVNNIIVKNGTAGTTAFGGAKLKPETAPCEFFNNTIYGNQSKATKVNEVGGVRCETVGIKVINNIFWSNTYNGATTKTDARQYDPNCEPTYNLEQLDASATPAPTNITDTDPGLTKTGKDDEAGYYRITATSPAVDKGDTKKSPTYDYDLELRSDGKPDIGADEYLP
jgi:hypothetical protein